MGRRTVLLVVAVVVAALGATLVFIYVNGINNRALANQNPVQVLVARNQVNPGTSVSSAQAAGDFQLKTLPKSAVAEGAVSEVSSLGNQVALTVIVPGQQIVPQMFGTAPTGQLPIPAGDVAVSVQLTDYGRVAGFVQPGSHVAIFVSGSSSLSSTLPTAGTKPGQFVKVLLPNVEVLASGPTTITSETTTTNGQTNTEQISKAILTLAVTPAQAKQVIFSQLNATMYFGLLGSSTQKIPTAGAVTGDTITGS